eukprot:TRINITY_DN11796_c0_g1_i2.p1 TRINITY_DN11796_c0_g1~~TRINITY_DN11796_c0_g1_i2.p1  ORF type:complete len:1149 (+),score=188.94 TRINITY_DN11796_c0_g1_i2:80-3526(+)
MEVSLLEAAGIPDGCLLSIRAGTTRRQAPANADTFSLQFPKGVAFATRFKVDLLAPVGSASLDVNPFAEDYAVVVPPRDQGGHAINLKLRVREGVFKDGRNRGRSESPGAARERILAEEARVYLEAHGLLPWVQDLLQAVIRDRPDDPWDYIDDHVARTRPTPSTRDEGFPTEDTADAVAESACVKVEESTTAVTVGGQLNVVCRPPTPLRSPSPRQKLVSSSEDCPWSPPTPLGDEGPRIGPGESVCSCAPTPAGLGRSPSRRQRSLDSSGQRPLSPSTPAGNAGPRIGPGDSTGSVAPTPVGFERSTRSSFPSPTWGNASSLAPACLSHVEEARTEDPESDAATAVREEAKAVILRACNDGRMLSALEGSRVPTPAALTEQVRDFVSESRVPTPTVHYGKAEVWELPVEDPEPCNELELLKQEIKQEELVAKRELNSLRDEAAEELAHLKAEALNARRELEDLYVAARQEIAGLGGSAQDVRSDLVGLTAQVREMLLAVGGNVPTTPRSPLEVAAAGQIAESLVGSDPALSHRDVDRCSTSGTNEDSQCRGTIVNKLLSCADDTNRDPHESERATTATDSAYPTASCDFVVHEQGHALADIDTTSTSDGLPSPRGSQTTSMLQHADWSLDVGLRGILTSAVSDGRLMRALQVAQGKVSADYDQDGRSTTMPVSHGLTEETLGSEATYGRPSFNDVTPCFADGRVNADGVVAEVGGGVGNELPTPEVAKELVHMRNVLLGAAADGRLSEVLTQSTARSSSSAVLLTEKAQQAHLVEASVHEYIETKLIPEQVSNYSVRPSACPWVSARCSFPCRRDLNTDASIAPSGGPRLPEETICDHGVRKQKALSSTMKPSVGTWLCRRSPFRAFDACEESGHPCPTPRGGIIQAGESVCDNCAVPSAQASDFRLKSSVGTWLAPRPLARRQLHSSPSSTSVSEDGVPATSSVSPVVCCRTPLPPVQPPIALAAPRRLNLVFDGHETPPNRVLSERRAFSVGFASSNKCVFNADHSVQAMPPASPFGSTVGDGSTTFPASSRSKSRTPCEKAPTRSPSLPAVVPKASQRVVRALSAVEIEAKLRERTNKLKGDNEALRRENSRLRRMREAAQKETMLCSENDRLRADLGKLLTMKIPGASDQDWRSRSCCSLAA